MSQKIISETEVKNCKGKRHYSTKKYAKMVSSRLSKKKGYKLGTYKCPVCKNFHLTSQGLNIQKPTSEDLIK